MAVAEEGERMEAVAMEAVTDANAASCPCGGSCEGEGNNVMAMTGKLDRTVGEGDLTPAATAADVGTGDLTAAAVYPPPPMPLQL